MNPSLGLTPGAVRWAPRQKPTGAGRGTGGAGGRPAAQGQGVGGALPPARRRPLLLALSPRGQALQGKQKSVVNTVPNPKWLVPNCNPIKVRLVYLSSSGLFITVQMAATFGRLSSSLPAARHAKLSSTESGPAPVQGRERGPPGHAGSRVPLPLSAHALPPRPPPRPRSWWPTARAAAPPSTVLTAAPTTPGAEGAPNDPRRQVLPGAERKRQEPRGGAEGPVRTRGPGGSEQGAPWGAHGDAGGKIKPGKIKGQACSLPACGEWGGGGAPGIRSRPRPLQAHVPRGLWRRVRKESPREGRGYRHPRGGGATRRGGRSPLAGREVGPEAGCLPVLPAATGLCREGSFTTSPGPQLQRACVPVRLCT